MKAIWIITAVIIVTIVIILVGYYAAKSLMPPNPNVGDATKLERTFTQEELSIIKDRNFTMEEVAEHDGRTRRRRRKGHLHCCTRRRL